MSRNLVTDAHRQTTEIPGVPINIVSTPQPREPYSKNTFHLDKTFAIIPTRLFIITCFDIHTVRNLKCFRHTFVGDYTKHGIWHIITVGCRFVFETVLMDDFLQGTFC